MAFSPTTQLSQLAWDSAGSKTVAIPAGVTAIRVFTRGQVAMQLGASANSAGMQIANALRGEVFGVTPETNVSFYAGAGSAVQVSFGTDSGGGSNQGPAGPAGPQGPQGVPGPDGAAGAAGATGLSVLNGTGAPGAGVGRNGEFYIDTVANLIYGPKASGSWPGVGLSIVGVQGPAGNTGAKGNQGDAGPQGSQGIQGPIGPQGAGLIPNGYGVLNEAFITARQVAAVPYIFVVNPSGDQRSNINAPATLAGDMSRHVIGYNPTGTVWSDYGFFTGTQGPPGATGPQGPTGPAGAAGGTGATGPAGRTILNGSGAPTSQGSAGDYYIDNTARVIYGPKAGSWPGSPVSMVGTVGPQGPAGAAGATGPQGPQGPTGAAGANGSGVPAITTNGYVLTIVGGVAAWAASGGGGGGTGYQDLTAGQRRRIFTDFLYPGPASAARVENFLWTSALGAMTITPGPALGTYAQVSASAWGQIISSNTVGQGSSFAADLVTFNTTQRKARFTARMAVDVSYTSLLDAQSFLGLASVSLFSNAGSSSAIGFRFSFAENSYRFVAFCRLSGTTETIISTSVAVAQQTIYELAFEINAAGTSVAFMINGTPVGTITTNIPSGTAILYPTLSNFRTVGTSGAKNYYVDFVEFLPDVA